MPSLRGRSRARRHPESPDARVSASHRVVAIALISALGAMLGWALVARLRRRPPGEVFMAGASGVAVAFVAQASIGIALVARGAHRPALHYVYGVASLLVLGAGIGLGRALTRDRWVPVATCAAIALALAARAFATGLR